MIVRGNDEEDIPLQVGIVEEITSDGNFMVKCEGAEAAQAIVHDDVVLAPEDELLYEGARVGVAFPQRPGEIFTGIVIGRNSDGTYAIKYDSGAVHDSIPREMITLYCNDQLKSGDRVIVKGKNGKVYPGTIIGDNLDGTFAVQYDSGSVQNSVLRELISLAPSDVSFFEGDQIKIRSGNGSGADGDGAMLTAVITQVNADDSYVIRIEETGQTETIMRTDIQAYHNGVNYVPCGDGQSGAAAGGSGPSQAQEQIVESPEIGIAVTHSAPVAVTVLLGHIQRLSVHRH